jgi:hypothetical protein
MGFADSVSVKLGKTIDELVEKGWSRVLATVILFVDCVVTKAEIRAQIDDARGKPQEFVPSLRRRSVGQAEKDEVGRLELVELRELQVGHPAEIGMRSTYGFSGEAFRACSLNLDVGMGQQQA